MSVTVPNQTVAITRSDLPTPDFRRWQLAITDAVNNPAEVVPVPPVTGDYLPLSTFVRGVDGIAFYGALSTGGVLLGLETLADSGTGALLGITRDAQGRVSGTTDATITGTAGQITVANGDAVAGPPTVSLVNTAVTPGSYTNANITVGADGRLTAAASGSGVGYAEGASFPGSPSTNDKFYRTDLNLLCYYDGTHWLTVNEYQVSGIVTDLLQASSLTTPGYRWPVRQDFGTYLTRLIVTTFVAGTNNGSNYYTFSLSRRNAANANTLISSFTTAADAGSTWVNHDQAINAVLDASALQLQTTLTKTGSPAAMYSPPNIAYRMIVT